MDRTTLYETMVDYLDNQEISETAFNSFVRNCEAKLNRTVRAIDMEMCSIEKSEFGSAEYFLPADFLELISVSYNCSPLKFVSQDTYTAYYSQDIASEDNMVFTLTGGAIRILPVPCTYEDDIQCYYYKRIPPISEDQTTNWLLDKNPDVYLYGCLLEAVAYTQDTDQVGLWAEAYTTAINEINSADWDSKFSGAPLNFGSAQL